MLSDLFFRLGEAIGGLESQVRGTPDEGFVDFDVVEDADDAARPAADGGDAPMSDQDMAEAARQAALTAGAAWLASRLLRPRPIRWPRVILAGAAGSLLADLVGRTQDDAAAPHLSYAASPAELLGRVSAGIAVAAGYASILYPRLPGTPLLRGLAFGALEIAAAPRGGLVLLAAQAPGVRFPLQTLALPVDEHASPSAHLAFGLALGLLYRDARVHDEDEPDDDDDDHDFDDDDFEDYDDDFDDEDDA